MGYTFKFQGMSTRGRPKPDFSVSAVTETRAESAVSVSAETVTETETGAETWEAEPYRLLAVAVCSYDAVNHAINVH